MNFLIKNDKNQKIYKYGRKRCEKVHVISIFHIQIIVIDVATCIESINIKNSFLGLKNQKLCWMNYTLRYVEFGR